MDEYVLEGYKNSSLNILLTPKDADKLVKQNPLLLLDNIGFIEPTSITSYFCGHCNTEQKKPPETEVNIRVSNMGNASAVIIYLCPECGEMIIGSSIYNQETIAKINPDFIDFDETGKIKEPTPEALENLLARIEEEAKEGCGSLGSPSYTRKLELLQRLAGQIGYEADQERIEKLGKSFGERYISRFTRHLPDRLRRIKQKYFNLTAEGGMDAAFPNSGLIEDIRHLVEALPYLDLEEIGNKELQGIDLMLSVYEEIISMSRGLEEHRGENTSETAVETRSLSEVRTL